MQKPITLQAMQALLNQVFDLQVGATETTKVELVEVAAIKTNKQYSWQKEEDKKTTEKEPFTLVFRAPPDFECVQKTYEISQAQFGALGLVFLVPITQDQDGLYFEAIFN